MSRAKKNRAHAPGAEADLRNKFDYFRELLIESNLPLSWVPSPLTAAMMASAIPAAISPYSIAVAPDSSRKNFTESAFIGFASFAVPEPLGLPRFRARTYPAPPRIRLSRRAQFYQNRKITGSPGEQTLQAYPPKQDDRTRKARPVSRENTAVYRVA